MTPKQENEEKAVKERISKIKNIILVLSGKGGVGKSTVAVNIAAELARTGSRVGLLDVDIHGPSVPGMFGLENERIISDGKIMLPVEFISNLTVMSIGFLLHDRNDAVIWRGPMKYGVIRQFIIDVEWGLLDYLVVDCPPGTGDEPLSIAQLLGEKASAIVVTTPQRVSIDDVRKSIQFCRILDINILGIIENMSGFVCPSCGKTSHIFDNGGGEFLASEFNERFLGGIPIEPDVVQACDSGKPFVLFDNESITAEAFRKIAETIKTENNE